MYILKKEKRLIKPEDLVKLLNVRKAVPEDFGEIYNVSCTVGTDKKDPEQGFLIDNYISNPIYYLNVIKNKIKDLEHFYVAEYGNIYGYLIAYTKEEWILNNPNWIDSVQWKPGFDRLLLDDFIVIDKTAISGEYTGYGIGSMIYERLLQDLRLKNINNIFAETMVSPQPNFASLNFRIKQSYEQVGVNYYSYQEGTFTDLVYYKTVGEAK